MRMAIRPDLLTKDQIVRFLGSGTVYQQDANGGVRRLSPKLSKKFKKRRAKEEIARIVKVQAINKAAEEKAEKAAVEELMKLADPVLTEEAKQAA